MNTWILAESSFPGEQNYWRTLLTVSNYVHVHAHTVLCCTILQATRAFNSTCLVQDSRTSHIRTWHSQHKFTVSYGLKSSNQAIDNLLFHRWWHSAQCSEVNAAQYCKHKPVDRHQQVTAVLLAAQRRSMRLPLNNHQDSRAPGPESQQYSTARCMRLNWRTANLALKHNTTIKRQISS